MELKNNNLNDKFKLYFHDPNSYDWEMNSYINLFEMKTIEEFWIIDSLIKDKVHLGMFFIMKNNIFPLWDNEDNINGCSFSLKILKKEAKIYWSKICILLLSNNITKEEHIDLYEKINGISISPKKNFCIIKIWLANCENNNPNIICDIENLPKMGCLFKKHLNESE